MTNTQGGVLLYQAVDGGPVLEWLERETVWQDARQLAELFGRDRSGIVRHIRNVYATGEPGGNQLVQKKHRLLLTAKSGRWISTPRP